MQRDPNLKPNFRSRKQSPSRATQGPTQSFAQSGTSTFKPRKIPVIVDLPIIDMDPKDLQKLVGDVVHGALESVGGIKIRRYDGKEGAEAINWLEDYEAQTSAKGWKEVEQIDRIYLYLADAAKEWYKLSIKLSDNPPKTWEVFKKLFLERFLGTDYNKYIKDRVENRKQAANEPVDDYITSMRLYCFELNPSMTESQIMDHIYKGILPQIKRTLFAMGPSSLKDDKNGQANSTRY